MKLITLFVGRRLDHVINFDHKQEKEVEDTYIIEYGDGETELFAFYRHPNGNNEIIFQKNDGESTAHIKSISASTPTRDNININIVLSTAEADTEMKLVGLDKASLEFDSQDSFWTMNFESERKETLMIDVTFQLQIEDHNYQRTLHLCMAEKKDISDIVLDFGSEASQIGIFKRNEAQREDGRRELFDEMKNLLSSSSPAPSPSKKTQNNKSASISSSYVQEDNDKHFFKSVFFAKKNFDDNDAGEPIPKKVNGHLKENPIMKMLTTQIETQQLMKVQGYIQIPNVKITQFGGVKLPKVGSNSEPILNYKEGYFYRASINHFILNALNKATTACVCLYVLMPNVYSPLDIITRLQWIRKDVIDILKNFELAKKIKAVELSAISESDASLLGAISTIEDDKTKTENVKPGKYIIIDAGKGTIDYSAIQYEKPRESNSRIHCVYRSGIIGAGNALTYAYLFALLRDYMNQAVTTKPTEDELISFIYENILGCTQNGKEKGGGDLHALLKLMQAVEYYKISVGSCEREADDHIDPLSSNLSKAAVWKNVEMETVTKYIKSMTPEGTRTYKPLSDEAGSYVTKTINQIVDEVCDNLSILTYMEYEKADGIIFAGRGFALQEFKETMKEKLEEKGIIDADKELLYSNDNANMKSVCLYIRNAIKDGLYDSHMISVPVVLRDTSSLSPNREGGKDWWTLIREFLFHKKKAGTTMFPNMGGFLLNCREGINHTPGSSDFNGMVSGFNLENIINGDSLMIGGTKYRMRMPGNVTIFFSSEGIHCRYTNGQNQIRMLPPLTDDGVNLQNSPFLFGTLFPNVAVDNINDIRLPYDPAAEREKQKEAKTKLKKTHKGQEKNAENESNQEENTDPIQKDVDDAVNISDPNGIRASATSRAHELADKV